MTGEVDGNPRPVGVCRAGGEFGEGVACVVEVGVGEAELPGSGRGTRRRGPVRRRVGRGCGGVRAASWRSWGWWRCSQWKARWTAGVAARRAMRSWAVAVTGVRFSSQQLGGCGRPRGSSAGYSTLTRKRPLGGAVGPAAARLRAARSVGDGVGRDAVRGGLDEGADEVADHVMEEAGAGDAVDEEIRRRGARRSGRWCG